jgi:hypothetical protein
MKYLMTALLSLSSTSFAETICVKRHFQTIRLELKAPKPPLPCFVYMGGKEIYTAVSDATYCPKMLAATIQKHVHAGYDCTTLEPTPTVKGLL